MANTITVFFNTSNDLLSLVDTPSILYNTRCETPDSEPMNSGMADLRKVAKNAEYMNLRTMPKVKLIKSLGRRKLMQKFKN